MKSVTSSGRKRITSTSQKAFRSPLRTHLRMVCGLTLKVCATCLMPSIVPSSICLLLMVFPLLMVSCSRSYPANALQCNQRPRLHCCNPLVPSVSLCCPDCGIESADSADHAQSHAVPVDSGQAGTQDQRHSMCCPCCRGTSAALDVPISYRRVHPDTAEQSQRDATVSDRRVPVSRT